MKPGSPDDLLTQALQAAARNFVHPAFADRFAHEASRKPARLRARVCHETDHLFQARYKGGAVSGRANETWYLLDGAKGFRPATWEEVRARMGLGMGLLAIDASGRRFHAESEDSSGREIWAGEA